MLNIKKGGRNVSYGIFATLLILFVAGCTEPGPRALLDGDRLLKEGKAEAAISRLNEAVHHLPQNARAWNHLGLAYHQVGQVDKAAQAYQKALSYDRNFATARFNLGCLYLEQNHTAEAIAHLTTYVNLDNKKQQGWLKLGAAQLQHAGHLAAADKAKMLEAARKCFEASLTLGSTAEAHNALGMIEVQRGKPRDAVRHFNSALATTPNHGPALLNLAILYHGPLHDPRAALLKYREYLASQQPSNQYREVENIARRLDHELNPPVAIPQAAAPVAQAPRPAPAQPAAAPAPKPPENKPEPIVSKPAPKPVEPTPVPQQPKPVATAPRTTPAPKPTPQPPVEVVKVADEPVATPAQDRAPAATQVVTPTPEPASPGVVTNVPSAPTVATAEEPQPEQKKSLLKKINPVSWFRGKTNEPKTVAEAPKPQPVTPIATVAPKPAPPRKEPSFARYQYLRPTKPKSGNRSAAMSFFNEAMGAQRTGNLARALEGYSAALRNDPAFFEAYYNFGLAAFQAGDLKASLHAYENALAISPDSADTRYNFALALQRANYPVDAARELEQVVSRNPNEVRGHLSLGNLYGQVLMDPAKARAHYQDVIRLDPQHSQAPAIRHWLRNNP